jgi:hypothetical protein
MLLKSSTLIESLIAMILIMLVFGMSMQIFLSKGGIGTNHNRFQAIVLGENIYNKTIAGIPIKDGEMGTPSLTADRIIEPFKESSSLFLLTILVFDKDSILLFKKKELLKNYVLQK